jgi:hypothetical protein
MCCRRFDPPAQLHSELRVNSSPGLKPISQVRLDRFGGNLRKCISVILLGCSGNLPAASGMKLFTPTASRRLNEVTGLVFLAAGVLFLLSLASFHPGDPSWNHVGGNLATHNLIGRFGAHLSDLLLQAFGLGAFVFPFLSSRWPGNGSARRPPPRPPSS